MDTTRRLAIFGVLLAQLGATLGLAPAGAASTPPKTVPVVDRMRHGRAALSALEGNGSLARVAALNHWSDTHLRTELGRDETLEVDPSGRLLYRDVAPELTANAIAVVSANAVLVPPAPPAPFPYAQTFALHSRLGSARVMYLDFVGFVDSSAQTYTPFDLDGQAGFSNSEMDAIQEIWARVAEAYSAFDVDVTTVDPGEAAIVKDSASDPQYGVRLVLGDGGGSLMAGCTPNCVGLAWTGAFGQSDPQLDPGGIVRVPNFASPTVRDLADTAVHELGHTLGLLHTSVGAGPLWAPVMTAVISDAPLAQFSNIGTQDEYAVMATSGVLPRADEASPRAEPTGSFGATGVISTPSDVDSFTVTVPAGAVGATTIAVTPSTHRPSLDLAATLTASDAHVVATSDPPATVVDSDSAAGLSASITATLPPGAYTLSVQGTGLAGFYSSYGSIGSYTVAVAVPVPPSGFRITTATLPAATLGQAYRVAVTEADGVAPIKWKRIGKLPPGLKLAAKTGVISGTPKHKTGTFGFTVQAGYTTKVKGHPAVKHTATKALSITVR